MPQTPPMSYAAWLEELQRLAGERGIAWAVSAAPGAHQDAYDRGLSVDEVIGPLADMAEWRGCGCGTGGG